MIEVFVNKEAEAPTLTVYLGGLKMGSCVREVVRETTPHHDWMGNLVKEIVTFVYTHWKIQPSPWYQGFSYPWDASWMAASEAADALCPGAGAVVEAMLGKPWEESWPPK